jgi:hypothetical protein
MFRAAWQRLPERSAIRQHGRHDKEHASHRWVGAAAQQDSPTGRPRVAPCGEPSTTGAIILQLDTEAKRFSVSGVFATGAGHKRSAFAALAASRLGRVFWMKSPPVALWGVGRLGKTGGACPLAAGSPRPLWGGWRPTASCVSRSVTGGSPVEACGRGSGTKMPFVLLIRPLHYLST